MECALLSTERYEVGLAERVRETLKKVQPRVGVFFDALKLADSGNNARRRAGGGESRAVPLELCMYPRAQLYVEEFAGRRTKLT